MKSLILPVLIIMAFSGCGIIAKFRQIMQCKKVFEELSASTSITEAQIKDGCARCNLPQVAAFCDHIPHGQAGKTSNQTLKELSEVYDLVP